MVKKQERRKQYLINKKFQLNFTFRFLRIAIAFILLTGLVLGLLFYFKYQFGGSIFNNYLLLIKEGGAVEVTNMFKALITTPIIPVIIISTLVIAIFITVYGIVYSHKIAGPVYRINKILESISKGIINIDVKFRKKDYRELID